MCISKIILVIYHVLYLFASIVLVHILFTNLILIVINYSLLYLFISSVYLQLKNKHNKIIKFFS